MSGLIKIQTPRRNSKLMKSVVDVQNSAYSPSTRPEPHTNSIEVLEDEKKRTYSEILWIVRKTAVTPVYGRF